MRDAAFLFHISLHFLLAKKFSLPAIFMDFRRMRKTLTILLLLYLFITQTFSQSKNGSCTLIVEAEKISSENAVVKLIRLTEEGNFDTFSVINLKQNIINIETKEPFNVNASLLVNNMEIAGTSTFLITHDTIRILFKKFPARSSVTGGENDFANNNRTLLFALPGIITSDPAYSHTFAKQSYSLNIKAIPLKFYYEEYEDKVIEIVATYPNYAYVLRALNSGKERLSLKTLDSCYSLLTDTLRKIKDGRDLRKYIDAAKRNLPGNIMPSFVAWDMQEKQIGSQLIIPKGKYVLLDFWASWCTPCRQQMKQLVNLYPKMDTTKIQIISLSIDEKSADWVEAIKQDQLRWKNYYDPKGITGNISREFNLTYIPQNRLIDAQAKIIAADMTLEDFNQFLKENNLLLRE